MSELGADTAPGAVGSGRHVASNPSPVAATVPPVDNTGSGGGVLFGLAIAAYCVLTVVLLLVMLYLLAVLGAVAFVVAGVLALIPLVIVLLGIRWIDRWEPEPLGALVFAFLWGAAASVAIALIFDLGVQIVSLLAGTGESATAGFVSAVVQAPFVEEIGKGFGILIIFWAMRRQFDGPVDGIVYGSMIAVGFAFTENIQYFGVAFGTGADGSAIASTFVMRGLMSPFAHVMFTACTGLIVGFASRRASTFGIIGWFVLGLIPAIALHAFWNASAMLVSDFLGYYVLVQVPLFAVGIFIVAFLRRRERALTRVHLQEYASAGWFTDREVEMLSTGAGRRTAAAWARSAGIGPVFDDFSKSAVRLAFTRHRIVIGRDRGAAQSDETALLARITADRAELATPR